jgi:serine/threonine-protein kinase
MNSSRPADSQLPRAGDVVAGKYRVESVIGQGGMGVVLGALDTSLGRRVAIKFLSPGKSRNESAMARFVREARAAASIQSEHVVRVFEVSTLPNGASYIVMEHLSGGDLSQVLNSRGPLPMQEAVDYLLQACEAIGEAHGYGIVHRDLKPQNLFLMTSPDGLPFVKVLDFGISKAIDDLAPNLTSTDAVMGTPLYMSPEQVRSLKNVDLRSDIWALGAILFELMTNAPVFEAATVTALCAAIAMDPPIPLRAKRPDAPQGLEAVILRCMHKDPLGRYEDVAAFADALAPFASERGHVSIARISRVVRSATHQNGLLAAPNHGASANAATGGMTGGGMGATTGGMTGGGMTGGGMTGGGMTGGGMNSVTGSGPYPAYGAPNQPSYGPPPHAPSFVPPSNPSNYPLGTTGGGFSNLPPGAVAAQGYTGYGQAQQAQLAQRSTTGAWQNQTGGGIGKGGAPKKSGAALFAILGIMAALFLLTIVAGGGLFVYSRKTAADEAAAAQAAAGAAAAATVAATPGAAAGAGAGTAPVVAAGTGAATPVTTPKKLATTAAKDAGAAAVTPSAPASPVAPGAPTTPTPTAAEEEAAKNARLKQIAQGRCSNQQFQLSRNDATNSAARSVKQQSCLQASSLSPNSGAAQCDRANCRTACTILKDQPCLQQLDFAERSNPLKF